MRQQLEKGFMEAIKQLAHLHGWKIYHCFDSRRSDPGFPDLVLVRRATILFCEVKAGKGKLSPAQEEWIAALRKVEESVQLAQDGMAAEFGGGPLEPSDYAIQVFVWRREVETIDKLEEVLK